MFSKEVLGSRLSDLRRSSAYSMRELGAILGVSDEAVRLMEKGKRAPSVEVLCAISEVFGVTVDYLVGTSEFPDYSASEDMVPIPKFPSRLKELRELKGMDIFTIAPLVGESPRNYAGYESGEVFPRMRTLLALADCLDVSLDYLCGRSDELKEI